MHGPVVEVCGALVGEPDHCLVRGTAAVLDGLGRVSGPGALEVVVRQLGEQFVVRTRLALQGRGDALMQSHAPHRRQLREQRLTDEGVVEPVPTARLLDHDAGLRRFVECVDQVGADHLLHQLQRKPAAHHRSRTQRLVGVRRQARQPARHRFANTLRQAALVPLTAALIDMAQRLDEEERISTSHRRQGPAQFFVVVTGFGDIGAHLVLVQSGQIQPMCRAIAVQVGEHGGQRMRAVQVGAAVGGDDLHLGLVTEAQQVPQQEQRGFGRPVQVIEDQHHRRARGGDSEYRDDGVEQCVALGVGIGARRRGQIGQQIDQPRHEGKQRFQCAQSPKATGAQTRRQRANRFGERLVRRPQVLVTPSVQDHGALVVGLSRPFTGQTCLADTGLTRDQDRVGDTGERGLPRGLQIFEFASAPDEWSGSGQYGR